MSERLGRAQALSTLQEWTNGESGFAVISPDGKLLKHIDLPDPHHTSLAISPDGRSIYITALDANQDQGADLPPSKSNASIGRRQLHRQWPVVGKPFSQRPLGVYD